MAHGHGSASDVFLFKCCLASSEAVRTIRVGDPRTATSTFRQFLSSDTSTFNVALRPLRPYGLIRIGSPGRPPRLSHSPKTVGHGFAGKQARTWWHKNNSLLYARQNTRPVQGTRTPGCIASEDIKMMMMMSWCLMSSDAIWHIRDKLWPMPKHGSIKATYVRCMRV